MKSGLIFRYNTSSTYIPLDVIQSLVDESFMTSLCLKAALFFSYARAQKNHPPG
jgi:hypothetical protein